MIDTIDRMLKHIMKRVERVYWAGFKDGIGMGLFIGALLGSILMGVLLSA